MLWSNRPSGRLEHVKAVTDGSNELNDEGSGRASLRLLQFPTKPSYAPGTPLINRTGPTWQTPFSVCVCQPRPSLPPSSSTANFNGCIVFQLFPSLS